MSRKWVMKFAGEEGGGKWVLIDETATGIRI